MNEIWKNGMEACSTKALSEHLGISRSSFYNAFGSWEALFKEALGLYFTRTPDQVLAHIGDDREIPRIITGFFREVCRLRAVDPEARGCMAVNCVAELIGVDEQLGPVLELAIQGSIDRFETLLERAVRSGALPEGTDLRAKALAVQNLLVGINLMSKVVRSEADLWATARQTLQGLGLYRE